MLGGRNPATPNVAGVALVTLDPLQGGGHAPNAAYDYNLAVWRNWILDPLKGFRATADNGGRGLFSVSNKPSEHNILNSNPRVVVAWAASYTQRSPMWQRILSSKIPLSAQK